MSDLDARRTALLHDAEIARSHAGRRRGTLLGMMDRARHGGALTRDELSQWPSYRARGFNDVPARFDPSYKAPCWRGDGPRSGLLCLPGFFILGTPKSGTTALYALINDHPDVVRVKKEPHWWDFGTGRIVPGYIRKHYMKASREVDLAFNETGRQLVFGDGSASTFWYIRQANYLGVDAAPPGTPLNETAAADAGRDDGALGMARSALGFGASAWRPGPLVPELLRAVLPEARLIVVLRDPTERAVSEFAYVKPSEEGCCCCY